MRTLFLDPIPNLFFWNTKSLGDVAHGIADHHREFSYSPTWLWFIEKSKELEFTRLNLNALDVDYTCAAF